MQKIFGLLLLITLTLSQDVLRWTGTRWTGTMSSLIITATNDAELEDSLTFTTAMRTTTGGDDAIAEWGVPPSVDSERVPDDIGTAYCTCPNGTPTISSVFGGTGGTLCVADNDVDCSACDPKYTLSAAAGAGNQTCVDSCLINLPALKCTALKACHILHCANFCGKGFMCQAYAAQWKLSSCGCQ